MALVEWNDDLKIGLKEVDDQHHILVRAVNLLHMGLERNCSNQLMGDIFATLTDYTHTHFSDEEKMFDAAGYEDSENHKKAHKALLNRFEKLKADWETGNVENGQEVLDFLVNWLKKHILETDVDYLPAVLAHQKKNEMKKAG